MNNLARKVSELLTVISIVLAICVASLLALVHNLQVEYMNSMALTRNAKIFVAVFLIVACGNGGIRLQLMAGNPEDTKTTAYLSEISNEINQTLGCEATLVSQAKPNQNRRAIKVFESSEVVAEQGDDIAAFYLSEEYATYNYIFYSTDELAGMNIKVILIHELGHAFGLEHHEGTVMQERYKRGIKEDEAYLDLKMLLDKKNINPCE